MNGKRSNFRRQLKNRTKTLVVLALMICVPIFQTAKSTFGFESSQELIEEMIIWLIRFLVIAGFGFGGVRIVLFFIKGRTTSSSKLQRQVVRYWYQSILDGKLSTITERDLAESKLIVSFDELVAGRLKEGPPTNLFSGKDVIEVLVAPIRLQANRATRTGAKESVIPYWIPALLRKDGEIVPPDRELYPWIPRQFLEPASGDATITVGEIRDLERFVFAEDLRGNWARYFDVCEKLFKSVSGDKILEFNLEGHSRDQLVTVFINPEIISGTFYIEALYERILNGKLPFGLLKCLANPKVTPKRSPSELKMGSRLHTAQFQGKFPLSESQRIAVHESFLLPEGNVLAVTGPPGTGKTTIIQSMIGSPWVKSALDGSNYPPITLCCSSSNQATINILRAFREAAVDRWLPQIDTYGLFCSSKAKAETLTDTLFTVVSGDGNLSEFENRKFVKAAEVYYLDKFSSQFFKANRIQLALKHLQTQIRKKQALLKSELASGNPDLNRLDTSIRFEILALAARYWEGRWIEEVVQVIKAKENSNSDKRRKYFSRKEWQIRSMLTPCFVSTFAMAPEYFGNYFTANGDRPPIDLLIADESGQVSPEIAAPTFALARKAVVIGDIAQLEPVWSVLPPSDQGNLVKFKLLSPNEPEKLRQLEQSGLMASSGNLMSRALTVCNVEQFAGTGIFLSEHRRSVPRIVSFANDLAYDGRLTAMRAEIDNRKLPVFGYQTVMGQCEMAGRSRRNQTEAKAISSWLIANQSLIKSLYNKEVGKAVAVITPFTAQTKILKDLLLPYFSEMTIGTVHSLQGAERDIVIFSSVYDRNVKSEHIFNLGTNMLNVAVTRAKDSFIVFGDTSIFNQERKTPAGVLAKYLFDSSSNQIQ